MATFWVKDARRGKRHSGLAVPPIRFNRQCLRLHNQRCSEGLPADALRREQGFMVRIRADGGRTCHNGSAAGAISLGTVSFFSTKLTRSYHSLDDCSVHYAAFSANRVGSYAQQDPL